MSKVCSDVGGGGDIDLIDLMIRDLVAWSVTCTRDERAEWFNLLRETGNPHYRELILRSVVLWVIKLAYKKSRAGLRDQLSDLIQEGLIAVDRAIDLFDVVRDVSFTTYVTYHIKFGMQRFVEDTVYTIRLPVHCHEALGMARKTRRDLEQRWSRRATESELARELGMSEKRLRKFCTPRTLSLNTVVPRHVEPDEEVVQDESYTLGDVLVDVNSPSPLGVVMKRIDSERLLKELRQVIRNQFREQFKERAVIVFFCRYGLDGEEPQTLEALGRRFGITREAVRQICVKVEKKLRRPANRRFVALIRHLH